MNVIPAFLEDQSLILFGIHYDHDGAEKDRAFCTEGGDLPARNVCGRRNENIWLGDSMVFCYPVIPDLAVFYQ
jgi:hypothetical protein